MTALMKAPLRGVPVADGRSTREKMLAGELHYAPDPELIALGNEGRSRMKAFNETPRTDPAARAAAAKALFGRFGKSWVELPVTVDYGVHIEIGDFSFVNMNCTFLDSARITIGDHVMIATGVQVHHRHPPDRPGRAPHRFPRRPEFPDARRLPGEADHDRRQCLDRRRRDHPSRRHHRCGHHHRRRQRGDALDSRHCLAAGNPCRVIRHLPAFDASADDEQPSEWALAG